MTSASYSLSEKTYLLLQYIQLAAQKVSVYKTAIAWAVTEWKMTLWKIHEWYWKVWWKTVSLCITRLYIFPLFIAFIISTNKWGIKSVPASTVRPRGDPVGLSHIAVFRPFRNTHMAQYTSRSLNACTKITHCSPKPRVTISLQPSTLTFLSHCINYFVTQSI